MQMPQQLLERVAWPFSHHLHRIAVGKINNPTHKPKPFSVLAGKGTEQDSLNPTPHQGP